MKFLFLGAGAIGTYIGGSLAARGHRVAFVEQSAVAEEIGLRGLVVHRGSYTTTVREAALFTSDADALAAGPYDVCVFALKSFDTVPALEALTATGLDLPPVLSLQNGVDNEPTIEAHLGAGRVIAGTVTSAIGKTGVGEVVEETHRGVGIALGHELAPRVAAALAQAGIGTRTYDDAAPMKWSKLLTNLTGNATSAILDLPVGDLVRDRRLYEVEMAVQRECLAVMRAQGFGPVDLPGTPVRLLSLATRVPRTLAQPLVIRGLGSARGHKMPSIHIDLHSGRGRTEVDWINGAVARHGERLGVPTPVNRVLTDTVNALASGTRSLEDFRHRPEALLALLP